MVELTALQWLAISILFIWSGFVRSGLGFGGTVLSLPLMLLVVNDPLLFLPVTAVQVVIFAGLELVSQAAKPRPQLSSNKPQLSQQSSAVDWGYLRKAMLIMIVPKLVGVVGLITLNPQFMSGMIFVIVALYSLTYLFNKPFQSNSPILDSLFLVLGAYTSGVSLVGAPLIIAVFASHVAASQLRATLFALWLILVAIKLVAFVIASVDMQWLMQLYMLPAAAIGHWLGLRFHTSIMRLDQKRFYQILGAVLLLMSLFGGYQLVVQ